MTPACQAEPAYGDDWQTFLPRRRECHFERFRAHVPKSDDVDIGITPQAFLQDDRPCERTERAEELRQMIHRWIDEMDASMPLENPAYEGGAAGTS